MNDTRYHRLSGFTIIELLIAMAATLIIMAALTRAFGLVGNAIRDSRAEVQLSSQSRDLMFGIRSELSDATVSMDPNDTESSEGYLVYYEGPTTDTTTTTYFGGAPAIQPGYFPLSRWGDTDDYLAFTAKTTKESPFTGIVPLGVLEAARAQALGGAYVLPAGYNAAMAQTPQIIQSQFAEVIYWMAPRMARTAAGGLAYEVDDGDATDNLNEDGIPQYVDVDADGHPDEFVLYRRVLLIRPDLNVTAAELVTAGFTLSGFGSLLSDQPTVGFMRADGNVEPCGFTVPAYNAGIWDPGAPGVSSATPDWLIGTGRVQQAMDLSVAREMQHNANTLSTGRPLHYYSANTLELLRDPHRRFAHVMVPSAVTFAGQLASISAEGCSMPLLALSPPTKFVARGPTWPNSSPTLTTNLTQSSTSTVCDRFTMVGHLRPEFALGGVREGEDIVAANALGFDVQIYDPGAPIFATVGFDGQPGVAGIDDNGNGVTDVYPPPGSAPDYGELGAIQSDDQLVTPNDPFFYNVARLDPSPPLPWPTSSPISRGAFVDLGYAQQPGGTLRFGVVDPDPTLGAVKDRYFAFFSSPFSGLSIFGATASPDPDLSVGMRRSGKFVIRSSGAGFLQPTFDTWTASYEHDNLNQVLSSEFVDAVNGTDVQATIWTFNGSSSVAPTGPAPTFTVAGRIDLPDPLNNQNVLAGGSLQTDSMAPTSSPLQSLKITYRNYDGGTRQVDQLEVIKDFD